MSAICLLALPVLAIGLAFQDPAPGIGRSLAAGRSRQITDVRYRLRFELEPGMTEVAGQVRLSFRLAEDATVDRPVVLDFAGHGLARVRVNGVVPDEPPRQVAGHLVLEAALLRGGTNTFEATFRSAVANTGTPLTSYRDPSDGREYLYTLVVPADAHRLFPCFDQPDLKATFQLDLGVPRDWVAVGNGQREPDTGEASPTGAAAPGNDGRQELSFAATAPLSTYLFAFAAGPFDVVESHLPPAAGLAPERPVRMFVRASKRPQLDQERLFELHHRALVWLADYFDVPYPFGKLDIVLVPGFPYGGMEHAGAIFYRESALVFDHAPTEGELIRRSTLIYHEVCHQWFGNLVTMEWFDDLWLKEGFATFIGYTVLDALEPDKNAWLRFHQRVKPIAYAVDATAGTTPIYQELHDLADAKSAYGAIVYNKAPAVLRELEAKLGRERFRQGVRLFLREHAFDNARWQDLVQAFRKSAELSDRWSERWILAAGMPRVRADWTRNADGTIERMVIRQAGPKGEEDTWPLTVDILLLGADGSRRTLTVSTADALCEVADLRGEPAPAAVLLNPRDVAYGLFLLDGTSRDFLCERLPTLRDRLLRAVALSALFDSVREAELDPVRYADLAIRLLEGEDDPETHRWLLDSLATTLRRYLPPRQSAPRTARVADLLLRQLTEGRPDVALQSFRFLARQCATPAVLGLCRDLLGKERELAGLDLGRRDRFLAAAALLAAGDQTALAAEKHRVGDGEDVGKEVYLAEAAAAQPEVKERYFASYLNLGEPPEQWMRDSLDFFHWSGQDALTLPYLRRALEQVAWVKEHRKIFFMPAWIDAFVNGHSSPEALAVVQTFLAESSELPADIRRKVLQSVDGLERAVRIRETWQR